jgi:uncharacterized protein
MQYSEGKLGRVFMIRLEDGEVIPDSIEQFAAKHKITHGQAILIGGIGSGQVVSGPRYSDVNLPDPMLLPVDGAHEVVGVGVLAPDESGKAVLHIHASLGRAGQTLTGCLREGVKTWLIGEVILYEILGVQAARKLDKKSGFVLLEAVSPSDKGNLCKKTKD